MNIDDPQLPPLPDARVPGDFQDRVLQKIRHDQQKKQLYLQTAALCLLTLAAYGWRQIRQSPSALRMQPVSKRVESARLGVDWLLQTQNPDGGWSAESWGGHARFSPGVSALATLALLNAPEPVNPAALDAAISAMEKQLAGDLLREPSGPQFYNLILNLHTLTEVQKQRPDAKRQQLLRQCYALLLRTQQADGGWGYAERQPMGYEKISDANAAVTWWVCHLLKSRPPLQLPGAEAALAKGDLWLRKQILSPGKVAYQSGNRHPAGPDAALFWMIAATHSPSQSGGVGKADAYRDYFRNWKQPDVQLLENLQTRQSPNGAWENADDRWWQAGGKVYLTAISVLTQVPKGV